jgi:hypothetical protein
MSNKPGRFLDQACYTVDQVEQWNDVLSVCPAEFVRASKSIPSFTTNAEYRVYPMTRSPQLEWEKFTGFKGEVPKEVAMVDGGAS